MTSQPLSPASGSAARSEASTTQGNDGLGSVKRFAGLFVGVLRPRWQGVLGAGAVIGLLASATVLVVTNITTVGAPPTLDKVMLGVALISACIFVFLGYGWAWTGMGPYVSYRGKSLWDWLQLIIIPAVLAVGGIWFTTQQQRQAQDQAQRVNSSAQANQARDSIVSNYLDRMSDLLTAPREAAATDVQLHALARARTLATLQFLGDGDHKVTLLKFLYEAKLLLRQGPFVDLTNANLTNVDLSGTSLEGVNLTRVDLSGATLNGANLRNAGFSGSDLSSAHLACVHVSGHPEKCTDLTGATLSAAGLTGADFSGANLSSTDFRCIVAPAGIRTCTDLAGALLTRANLTGADLAGVVHGTSASVAGVTWSRTICPDGTKSDSHGHTCVHHGF